MKWEERIVSDKEVLLGKPSIKGSIISVEFILQLFADGWSEQLILENHPRLTQEDLDAVFAYVAGK